MHERIVLPLGDRCFPRRRGNDTRTLSAASSGQGHGRADRGLPTPCRREDSLHVPSLVPRQYGTGVKSTRQKTAIPLVQKQAGIPTLSIRGRHDRSMVQVRFLARWLCEFRTVGPVDPARRLQRPLPDAQPPSLFVLFRVRPEGNAASRFAVKSFGTWTTALTSLSLADRQYFKQKEHPKCHLSVP